MVTTAGERSWNAPAGILTIHHIEAGRELYHICQFAEIMEKNGATYEPVPASPLPENQPKRKQIMKDRRTKAWRENTS
jgi:tRNA isopentenyl-2-thiomethyl-A-37 hydroxylase MiaE